jgi:hypothetical protein
VVLFFVVAMLMNEFVKELVNGRVCWIQLLYFHAQLNHLKKPRLLAMMSNLLCRGVMASVTNSGTCCCFKQLILLRIILTIGGKDRLISCLRSIKMVRLVAFILVRNN